MRGRSVPVLAVVFCLLGVMVVPARALRLDEGWLIERLAIRLDIQRDGSIVANDAIDVDFRGRPHHGIFRDIRYQFFYDETQIREYDVDLTSVRSADGRTHKVQTSSDDALRRFKIGDPNRTISGKETYRLTYRIGHALNGFPDHDELYWNATGVWPVTIAVASVTVSAPGDAIDRVDCFQGPARSTEHCHSTMTAGTATFMATRPLESGDQMTIVTGLRKGVVAQPSPRLVRRPRTATEMFDTSHGVVMLMYAGFLAAIGGVGVLWWRAGRDRRYIALHHAAGADQDQRVPLFGSRPIAVEFEPPEKIRPAQMGLLIDERADTLDITATIVDLAVRGYLKITEIPKTGWFGHKDWQIDRLKPAHGALLGYERIVLNGLFDNKASRKLSELKNKFHDDLEQAKTALYKDAIERKWFPKDPSTVRLTWFVLGVLGAGAGVALMIYLGRQWGAGLLGLPVIAGGLLVAIVSKVMPRRSAAGTEMLQRTLGFAKYIRTAETQQQAFAERAHIFTDYLPYAIAFKCVDQWARAFKDIDLQQATAGWYAGTTGFNVSNFSSSLGAFSSSVSNTISSTPGGSGGSGFGGGSSGGGGGGGGGGGW